MTDRPQLVRCTRLRPCPICQRPDWCSMLADGSGTICMRVSNNRPTKNGGWLHLLEATRRPERRMISIEGLPDRGRERELGTIADACRTAIHPEHLERLAHHLGLSVMNLKRLRVGWSPDHRAFTFPMRNAEGDVVGIRLRLHDGRKFSVRGGHEGLFYVGDLPSRVSELLVAEGPTDTASLLDMGFVAIGRPSCTGGVSLLVSLARHLRPSQVSIVADTDVPGQRGANSLADALTLHVPDVRVIVPPEGVSDARAWLNAGGTQEDVVAMIAAAEPRSVELVAQGAGRRL